MQQNAITKITRPTAVEWNENGRGQTAQGGFYLFFFALFFCILIVCLFRFGSFRLVLRAKRAESPRRYIETLENIEFESPCFERLDTF